MMYIFIVGKNYRKSMNISNSIEMGLYIYKELRTISPCELDAI